MSAQQCCCNFNQSQSKINVISLLVRLKVQEDKAAQKSYA